MKAFKILTAVLLACIVAIGSVSCSSDDDNTPNAGKKILDTWVNDDQYEISYSFGRKGNGTYKTPGVSGGISYTVDGTTINMIIKCWNAGGGVWTDYKTGWYNARQDYIRIDGQIFTRKGSNKRR